MQFKMSWLFKRKLYYNYSNTEDCLRTKHIIQDYINKSKGEFSIFHPNSLCFESSSSYTELLKALAEIFRSSFFYLYFLSTPKSYHLFYLSIATSLEKTIISLPGYHSKAQSYWLLFLFLSLSTYNPVSKWCSRSDQIRSVTQSYRTLCDPMNRSTPGLPVHHQLPEFSQTYIHRVSDAIQPSHPLSSPSPLAPNPLQHQSLFQWVNSSHEVAKVLEFQL